MSDVCGMCCSGCWSCVRLVVWLWCLSVGVLVGGHAGVWVRVLCCGCRLSLIAVGVVRKLLLMLFCHVLVLLFGMCHLLRLPLVVVVCIVLLLLLPCYGSLCLAYFVLQFAMRCWQCCMCVWCLCFPCVAVVVAVRHVQLLLRASCCFDCGWNVSMSLIRLMLYVMRCC